MTVTALTIDSRPVTVPAGSTILAAAAQLGIRIPTLCHLEGLKPATACMVCVVEIAGRDGLAPACGTPVAPGMVVTTDSERVRRARKRALSLLLSEHVGDCVGLCQRSCPLGLDIPRLIRLIGRACRSEAAQLLRESLPTSQSGQPEASILPCLTCSAPCEKACRRGRLDGPVSIRLLLRFALNADGGSVDALPSEPNDPGDPSHSNNSNNSNNSHDSSNPSSQIQVTGHTLSPRVAVPGSGMAQRSCSTMKRLSAADLRTLAGPSADVPCVRPFSPDGVLTAEEAVREASRCLHCDCRRQRDCRLRDLATDFGARPTPVRGEATGPALRLFSWPDVLFEPGKCIKCGICVRLCEAHGVGGGFAFLRRGFDLTVGMPFGGTPDLAAWQAVLQRCVTSCPTGALAWM